MSIKSNRVKISTSTASHASSANNKLITFHRPKSNARHCSSQKLFCVCIYYCLRTNEERVRKRNTYIFTCSSCSTFDVRILAALGSITLLKDKLCANEKLHINIIHIHYYISLSRASSSSSARARLHTSEIPCFNHPSCHTNTSV